MGRQIGIRRAISVALAVLFVLCWASGFIGAKWGADEAPVLTLLTWRFLPLALLLLLFTTLVRRRAASSLTHDLGRHVTVGLLSQSGYLLTVYWAIGLGVSTGTTALVDGVQPLVVAALAGPLLGAAVTGRQWTGLVVGLVGVTVVCWSDATAGSADAPGWAYLLPLLGMSSLVASTFLERGAEQLLAPLQALTIHCSTSAMVLTSLALATGDLAPPPTIRFWLVTAWLVVLATFGGYGLYWVLVERIGVTAVNSLMFLIAPVTSVWGALTFGEPLGPPTVVGLGLTLVAAGVATYPVRARGRRPRGRGRSVRRTPCAPRPSPPAGRAKAARG